MTEDFAGAVLCGGASRRMGRDKALIDVDGRALAARVADVLTAAGARHVVAVGGDLAALRGAGLDAVPDDDPGEGPLGGILTALAHLGGGGPGSDVAAVPPAEIVFIAACDLVSPDPAAVRSTVAELAASPGAAVAVPVAGGRRQWLHAAWRPGVRPPLAAAFDAGERSVHGAVALAGLRMATLALAPEPVADADTPADLPGTG
jgi:molybdopterin-guanine dinucleotide biosynthesis protein A